jgi:hypothetical protein
LAETGIDEMDTWLSWQRGIVTIVSANDRGF